MSNIIAVINQKGGVGKSTTAQALGAGLHLRGQNVLFIDLDAQSNLTYALGAQPGELSAMEVLDGAASARDAICQTPQGDLIASSRMLANADIAIASVGKEYRLREALEVVATDYDYVVIDTPPALGILTVNALTACNMAIIPAQADVYSLQGIAQLGGTIATVRKYCNSALTVAGILLTRFNSRTVISRDMAELIEQTAQKLGTHLYHTTIRECIAIKEAQARRRDIFDYAAGSNAAIDYSNFINEFLERG